jgi:cytochrome c oxidase assembly factor CtaG
MRRVLLLLALALAPASGFAHAMAEAPKAGPEPWMLAPLLIAGGLYAVGYVRLRRRSERGRTSLSRHGLIFLLGYGVLAATALSPLHALGGRSFTAHMVEHELIMLAAAALLVWSRPLGVMIWAFPAATRTGLAAIPRSRSGAAAWRLASDPWIATAMQAAALWIWHLPSLFDEALRHEGWHAAQHLTFFVTALFFWSGMLGPRRSAWTSAACLFVTSMITGALGAFMALSTSPWYASYRAMNLAAFGLTPAEDQQLAGILMWVPGGLFHAIVAIALLAPHLRSNGLREASDV